MKPHLNKGWLWSTIMLAVLLLAGCNLPASKQSGGGSHFVGTSAAQTMEALRTQMEIGAFPATTSAQGSTTPTGLTSTQQTPILPLITLTLTPNAPCDRAGFVSETIPDGSTFSKGSTFTKTWTLKNTGTCTWNNSYSLVFVKGDAMGAQPQLLSNTPVAPGDTVQVTINLHAPLVMGSVRGDWMLRNAAGVLFGLGPNASETFWVNINVVELTNSLIDDMCAATWRNSQGILPCPGTIGDAKGFVVKVDDPNFENGIIENEPALWMNPEAATDGFISGEFPAIKITAGSSFKTYLGCQLNAIGCDVTYLLSYRVEGGAEILLDQWHKNYDKNWIKVVEDLNALAGKSVVFILRVQANNTSDQNQALWLLPRIVP